jgi:hypothetical protein
MNQSASVSRAATSLVALAAWICTTLSLGQDAEQPPAHAVYLDTLKRSGVEASGAGAVAYLRRLHPTPERQKLVAALIAQLSDGSFARREAAMQELMRLPNLPVAALGTAAEGNDPEVRWRTREILTQAEGKSAQVIYAALKTIAAEPADGAVAAVLAAIPLCRQAHLESAAIDAVRAAAKAGDAAAISESLAKGTLPQRVGAAAALCRISTADNREQLYPLLDDKEDRVALEVARSLADVGDRKSLGTLVRLLDAGDNQIRTAAIVTLRGLTGQKFEYAAYETGEARAAAIKKWATWVAGDGQTAELTFPVPRYSGARGDLAGHTLVTTGSRNEVKQIDPAGKTVFSFPIDAWSAEKLPSGNILISSYGSNRVIEVEFATKKVVWEHNGINAMKTKPLENGNILISDFNGHRVIEMARNKEIVWEQPTEQECFDCDRLPNGNTIFGCPNFVREVTPDHKLVREWKIDGRLNGFQALPSGNILVANFGRSEVVELTPDAKQVWRLEEPQPCDVFRLADGNMLVSTQRRIIEVAPDGKVLKVICEAQYGSARR